MAVITSIAMFIIDVIRAVLVRHLGDELRDSLPWLTRHLVQSAVGHLPSDLKERYEEEWKAHLNETPSEFAKLVTALGYCIAARRMDPLHGTNGSILDATRRAVEVSVTSTALIFLAPLIAIFALVIRLNGAGPVLARYRRSGLNGRLFRMYRFRTSGRIGKLLVRTGFSHLPVLLNVLRGDMTYVGPRPLDPGIVDNLSRFIPNYAERLAVKPGLTGLAMVELESFAFNPVTEFERDLYYVRNRNLRLNLAILIRSIPKMLTGSGEFY
jgi:lipopolysaccharide/colanic/teichoic acid biosynthesis glycosyltransferase